MLPLFDRSISTKHLHDMLEIIEVHDALKQQAQEKAIAEAKQNQKK